MLMVILSAMIHEALGQDNGKEAACLAKTKHKGPCW